jgi:hypothetical protein
MCCLVHEKSGSGAYCIAHTEDGILELDDIIVEDNSEGEL